MKDSQRTKQQDYPFGGEVSFDNLSGRCRQGDPSHLVKTIDDLDDMTLTGRYMSMKLMRLFVNIPLQSAYDGSIRSFIILEALFHNMWDYRLMSLSTGSVKMIDSEGFQHDRNGCPYYEFSKVVMPQGKIVEAQFPGPQLELEDHAKTKGWVWFDSLSKGVLPHRFLFQFSVFDPGTTSGWVRDSETLEFIIDDCRMNPIRQLLG